ncbi:MAG: ATP-dependent sacrificial sulfur transferase LarE [Thermoplasmata archaeon]|nr:ATP-dependent sacrificial sulfur transferase LarE [Thermoplasmata archaeon]
MHASIDLADSAHAIVARLAGRGAAAVALSGGVDSAVVAWLAHAALGERAVAITLTGPAVSLSEEEAATGAARTIGIRHLTVPVDPLTSRSYRANASDRCYFCRQMESGTILEWGTSHGIEQYLDGIHHDDLGEERPGLQAMNEAGFQHPLAEAGWGKAEVRRWAAQVGLPNWDRPSNACLASRIQHGTPIAPESLLQVSRAEALLEARGFRRVRVRIDPEGARVEVDPGEVARLLAEPTASAVRHELLDLGFARVRLDPRGYGALRDA